MSTNQIVEIYQDIEPEKRLTLFHFHMRQGIKEGWNLAVQDSADPLDIRYLAIGNATQRQLWEAIPLDDLICRHSQIEHSLFLAD